MRGEARPPPCLPVAAGEGDALPTLSFQQGRGTTDPLPVPLLRQGRPFLFGRGGAQPLPVFHRCRGGVRPLSFSLCCCRADRGSTPVSAVRACRAPCLCHCLQPTRPPVAAAFLQVGGGRLCCSNRQGTSAPFLCCSSVLPNLLSESGLETTVGLTGPTTYFDYGILTFLSIAGCMTEPLAPHGRAHTYLRRRHTRTRNPHR